MKSIFIILLMISSAHAGTFQEVIIPVLHCNKSTYLDVEVVINWKWKERTKEFTENLCKDIKWQKHRDNPNNHLRNYKFYQKMLKEGKL